MKKCSIRRMDVCSIKYIFLLILCVCILEFINNILLDNVPTSWNADGLYRGSRRLKQLLKEKHNFNIKDTQYNTLDRNTKVFGTSAADSLKIPKEPRYIIVPDTTVCAKKLELLIYVQSTWSDFMKRRYIRNTWAGKNAHFGSNVKTVFIIGKPANHNDQVKINNEHLLYGDILEVDIAENFQNLSLKCLSALNWINRRCNNTDYILKVDDDIFVNLFTVFEKVLPVIQSKSKLILCHVIEGGKSPIVRDKASKWYIPPSIFPNRTHLPRFCSGYFAIMTKTVFHDLYLHSQTTPLINVDDVYMFGHLTKGIKDLYFVDLKRNLTLFQTVGLTSYRAGNDDYLGVSVEHTPNMKELWSLTLNLVRSRITPHSKVL